MLPTELLMFRIKAGIIEPKRVKATPGNVSLVAALVQAFESNLGNKRIQLEEDLKTLEAGRSDYRMLRGLAHLLANDCAEFETGGEVEPGVVRAKVFELAQAHQAATPANWCWNRPPANWRPPLSCPSRN
jgi:predicted nuclease of restriction endonuclease-like RecB superfamily